MKMLGQAMRAVLVETAGVVLVLWLIFGTAIWTFERQGSGSRLAPTWADTLALGGLLEKLSGADRQDSRVDRAGGLGADGVARRLDHYRDRYSQAASQILNQLADDLLPPPSVTTSAAYPASSSLPARETQLAPRT